MDRLPHGYTNETELVGEDRVMKKYVGMRSHDRCNVEKLCLHALVGLIPIPRLIDATSTNVVMERLSGRHGQELIEEGFAKTVLRTAGELLRQLHTLSTDAIELDGCGSVIVHGDFGPQNLLFSRTGDHVTGLLDWEWAHLGEPIEDLAWAEWIVRMHHPNSTGDLTALFEGYGQRPRWVDRQASMLRRCEELRTLDPVSRGSTSADQLWTDRVAMVRNLTPLPDD